MVSLAALVVSETADVWLGFALLLHLNGHNLDLVVGEADLNLEHRGHNELVSLDRIEVVLLLLTASVLVVWLGDVHLSVRILLPITVSFVNRLHLHVVLLL